MEKVDIHTVIKPINSISKLGGLELFEEKHNGNKGLKNKSILRKFCPLFISMFIIITMITNYVLHYTIVKKTTQLDDIHLFQMPITTVSAVISLFVSNIKLANGMDDILNRMILLDDLLRISHDIYFKDMKFIKRQMNWLMILYIILIIFEIITFKNEFMSLVYCITLDIPIFVHYLIFIQFINLIYLIQGRLKQLNEYILSPNITNINSRRLLYSHLGIINSTATNHNYLLCDETESQSLGKINKYNVKFSEIVPTHFENSIKQKLHFQMLRVIQEGLCEISHSINDIYGFQILLITITVCTEIPSNLYYSILRMSSEYYKSTMKIVQIMKIILPIIWALFYFMILFLITCTCKFTSDESNRTAVLLQKLLLIPELHPGIRSEIKLFLGQASNRRIKFTAWDIFTMNLKFLGSVVGAIITLLVILVQFHKIV
ncbi:hypothetical protein L9F63_009818 [Diploptera punctata]|uniref:Gustatory receptor n=1 Tax=Diploptera punctata TaxID=6984 RepID=A0AAD8AIX7_DIPPU|nr:hypothetical protein L9F63_009818 [Diploptera punctata]